MAGIARGNDESTARKRMRALLAGARDFGGAADDLVGLVDPVEAKAVAERNASDMAADPAAATVGSILNPFGILGPVIDAGKDFYNNGFADTAQPPVLLSKDDFMASRRRKTGSLQEAMDAAAAAVEKSDAFKEVLRPTKRSNGSERQVTSEQIARSEALKANARKAAEKTWYDDQKNATAEQGQLDKEYEQHKADYNRQMEAFHGRSFADRHPTANSVLPLAGGLAAGLLTRGAFKYVNGKAGPLAQAADEAVAVGDPAKLAKATSDAQWWADNGGKIKGWTAAGAATLPVEARLIANNQDSKLPAQYQDAEGDWQPALAQQRAMENFSDPLWYLKEGALGLLTGGVGALGGAKTAKPPAQPFERIGKQPSTQEIADAEASIIASAEAKARVAAALKAANGRGRSRSGATPVLPPGNPTGGNTAGTQQLATGTAANRPVGTGAVIGPSTQPAIGTGTAIPAGSRANRSGLSSYDPAIHGPDSRQVIDDLLSSGNPMPSRQALTQQLMSRFTSPPQSVRSVQNRAGGTLDELSDLERLGLDIRDPAIRQALLDKAVSGTGGKLAIPLAAGGGAAAASMAPDEAQAAQQMMDELMVFGDKRAALARALQQAQGGIR